MQLDHWQRVDELYHRAVKLDSAQQAEFLDSHCADNPEVRREVESLLLYQTGPDGDLMDAPALEAAAKLMAQGAQGQSGHDPFLGSTLGNFKVVEKLGAGGMGVVYKALDLKLHRQVALKFLPEMLAHDPAALDRFRREARAASALNHPGICTIHDICENEGQPFIVMELLEGTTVANRIAGKPLVIEQVLTLGADIADALAAAHARGIIHRDIKPGNIFITKDGRTKILDFGLAKLQLRPSLETDAGEFSTAADLTGTGVTLGTVAYMSPEQARGQELDARTDLFSFGTTLYEMATGTVAFHGSSLAETFEAILNRQPESITRLNPKLPSRLQEITEKCLEKAPRLRYQGAAEIRSDLLRLKREIEKSGSAISQPPGAAVPRFIRRPVTLLASVVVLAAAIGSFSFSRLRTAHAFTDKDTIVLGDFTNTTGEPVFDNTLKEALAVSLEQSPFLNVLPDARVNQTLTEMKRAPGERISPDMGREICLRTASKAVLNGSITAMGSHYALQLKAINCQSGAVLGRSEGEAESREKVLQTLGQAATSLRSRLGESLPSVQKYDQPLEEVTTSSLEALQAYSNGTRTFRLKGPPSAIPFFKRAVELDPDFAAAYLYLSFSYGNAGQENLAKESLKRAYELRDRAIQPERYMISSQYYQFITGELPKSIEQLQLLIQEHPQHALAHLQLGGVYITLGQWENAVAESREAVRLQPEEMIAHACLGTSYRALNRLDEAQAVFDKALARNPDIIFIHSNLYYQAFLRNDSAAMQRQREWTTGKPLYEAGFLANEAETQAYYGHFTKARALASAANVRSLRDGGSGAASFLAYLAQDEALMGNARQALRGAQPALAMFNRPDVHIFAASALAEAGDFAAAQKLADVLTKEAPLDTLVQNYHLPVLRAQIALKKGDAQRALELLEMAKPYELGGGDEVRPLYAAYVRGQAYLAAGNGPAAAAEFQNILDHRGLMAADLTGALAHLYLGRARALEARSTHGPSAEQAQAQARTAYQDFLTLWKDADPDIPILRQAKAEYDGLLGGRSASHK